LVNARGFTLVEAVIVAVVFAAILAVTIPWMRERHEQKWARLQTIAETHPWKIFEFRASPTKESFSEDEDFVVACEFVNRTDSELTFPKDFIQFALTVNNFTLMPNGNPSAAVSGMEIAAGKTGYIELRFTLPEFLYVNNGPLANRDSTSPSFITPMAQINYMYRKERGSISNVYVRREVYEKMKAPHADMVPIFLSTPFQISVEPSKDTTLNVDP
jgi:hypothetical protein